MSVTRVVAISGCDSGLGWALAARMAREGLMTIAGMLDTKTEAAASLKKYSARPFPLDVTKEESVEGFKNYVKEVVDGNPNHKLYAIINNAGVMTMGDFEWHTADMIHRTIDVNLLGAMRVVAAMLPELRAAAKDLPCPPRVINIASHCGLHALPGSAVYSASKAGLLALTTALRMELRDHGVKAVSFLPGGFIGSSKLLSNQTYNAQAMLDHLNQEQKSYYGTRILALSNYLSMAASTARYDSVKDENIIETFMKALVGEDPREMYKVEPFRYTFYYSLFKLPMPEALHHWLVKKFLNFPDE